MVSKTQLNDFSGGRHAKGREMHRHDLQLRKPVGHRQESTADKSEWASVLTFFSSIRQRQDTGQVPSSRSKPAPHLLGQRGVMVDTP